ncbi:MAG TPA: hypothetical protein VF475_09045 [Sphingobium sp.]
MTAVALRLGPVAAALGLLIAAFFFGRHVGTTEEEARYLRDEKKAAAKVEATIVDAQAQDAVSAAADVHRETIVREITREVPKIIDRPVYRNVCIDADGVRLIERAVATANGGGATGGRPDGAAGGVQ